MNYSTFKDVNSQIIKEKYEAMKLVVPALGFAFGRSRYDKEYADKIFRLHDCSSLVGDLLGFDTFLTHFLKALYDKEFEMNLETQQKRKVTV